MRRISLAIGLLSIILLILSASRVFALCEVDLDNDGDFDGHDIALFAAEFGRSDNCLASSLYAAKRRSVYSLK